MYSQHFDLTTQLNQEPRLISSPDLYNADDQKIYAAILDTLAQPLPTGEESPFSSKSPTTGHAILSSVIAYYQSMLGHEFNLIADRTWIMILRLLGVELSVGAFPVINLVFEGTIGATVSAGVEIRSNYNPRLSVYTTAQATLDSTGRAIVPARLNSLGALPNVRNREFTVMPRSLSQISSVYNDGTVINEGRAPETIAEAVLRAREGIRTGSLGRELNETDSEAFLGRCVSKSDYYYWAKRFGATKANVLKGIQYGANGVFGDLVTVVVYPETICDIVVARMLPMTLHRFDVRPAEIIPIDGLIKVRTVPNLNDAQVFNLVATAVATEVNPPYGKWGDTNFGETLSIAMEKVNGIYGTYALELKNAITNEPIDELEIKPWNLLEIRSSIVIQAVR